MHPFDRKVLEKLMSLKIESIASFVALELKRVYSGKQVMIYFGFDSRHSAHQNSMSGTFFNFIFKTHSHLASQEKVV